MRQAVKMLVRMKLAKFDIFCLFYCIAPFLVKKKTLFVSMTTESSRHKLSKKVQFDKFIIVKYQGYK